MKVTIQLPEDTSAALEGPDGAWTLSGASTNIAQSETQDIYLLVYDAAG